MPRFSIVLATKDRPEWLPRALASVTAQTLDEDWECVVFDNGESVEHLIPDDLRFRYSHGTADGPADAYQQAQRLAKGEILTPLADDDRLTPDALETVDREIGDAEWLVALTSFENLAGERLFLLGGPLDLDRLKQDYYMGGAIYWKRSLMDRVGEYDPSYDNAFDYEMYLRFALAARPKFVDKVLHRYTDHSETDSHVRESEQMAQTARIRAEARGV